MQPYQYPQYPQGTYNSNLPPTNVWQSVPPHFSKTLSSMNNLFPPATSYSVMTGLTSQNLQQKYIIHAQYPKHSMPVIASTSPSLRVLAEVNNQPPVNNDKPIPPVVQILNEDVSPGRSSRPVSVSPKRVVDKPLLSPVKKRVITSPTRRKNNHRIKGERVGERVAHIEHVLTKHKE